jgi:non-specific serine/threonine protein kinase
MLVCHGLWTRGGRLALWGEDSELPAQPPRRGGRRPKLPPHPFAAAAETLTAALTDLVGELAAKAVTSEIVLSLPTSGRAPMDSPELVRVSETAPDAGSVDLAVWRVPTIEYDQDRALRLLRALAEPGSPTSTVVLGTTVRHLVRMAEFADDLVTRGRMLPAVESAGSTATAVWRPVLTGADQRWAVALTLATPPAMRAEVVQMGEETTAAVVARTLDALVDAAARLGGRGPASGPGAGLPPVILTWLAALTGTRRDFAADSIAIAQLAEDLATWQREAFCGGAVRACFRLLEPPAEQDEAKAPRWLVEFALQAADEPSLVVNADRIWRSRGALLALARHVAEPQETLLGELGRASRLWPELDRALRVSRPSAVELDTAGAHQFLSEGAGLLAAAGFGVLLPSWWGAGRARLGVRLTARTRSASRAAPGTVEKSSGFGMEALVDYRWEAAIGDDALSEPELRRLAALQAPLVRVRGQWVELDPKHLAAGLEVLESGGTMTVSELIHTALFDENGPGGLPVLDVRADGQLGDLLSGAAQRRLRLAKPPKGFVGTLRPYQRRGLSWLTFLQSLGLGAVLADDMGLGKTIQVLALIAADPAAAGPTLLVCPMSLVGNWQREAARFTPQLRVHVHHGAERVRGDEFAAAATGSHLVITTYSLAARDATALGEVGWHRVVVDEAQAIKNAATKQAAAVRALPATHRVALTGTPVENRLSDLWSIMEFANPGLLGTAAVFKRRYAIPIERHDDSGAVGRLRRMTSPFVLRRLKTDKKIISDLPDKLEMEILCNLTAEQASLYQAIVDDLLGRIDNSEGIERRGLVLATMTKLKQVCNHPAQLLRDNTRLGGRSGKLARLEEILEEVLAAGEKALLFTQYAQFGGMLRSHLGARFDREILFLHGGVGKTDRDALVARFQEDAPPLFVLSLKAGGTGLNLTAANHVIHVDRWWNPAVEDQATDRAFRIGQRKTVQVRKFVCAGTVEEKISTMLREKRGLAEAVVSTGELSLTELSTDQLRELLTLEASAVVE